MSSIGERDTRVLESERVHVDDERDVVNRSVLEIDDGPFPRDGLDFGGVRKMDRR